MKISIRVIPNAKQARIKDENGLLKVYVTASAIEGKANLAVRKLLAKHFQVAPSRIEITKGLKSKDKTINIEQFKA